MSFEFGQQFTWICNISWTKENRLDRLVTRDFKEKKKGEEN